MKSWLQRASTALTLSLSSPACTYGYVSDATSNTYLGGVDISFQQPNLSGSSLGDVVPSLATAVASRTWSASDPGANGAEGIYYLNPFGTLNFADFRRLYVAQGWQRIVVSKSGYDTRTFYRNHQYTSCSVSQAQGPYSAGSYPYVVPGTEPYVSGSPVCAGQLFALYPSTSNYVKDPDIIVDKRTLNDREITETNCEGVAGRCLRVSVGTANVGDGDLWLLGNSNTPGVTQRRFLRDGSTSDTALPNAVFVYHPLHGHIHLQNWTNLRLRSVQSDCNTEATAANCPIVGDSGRKVSFCLLESSIFDSSYAPNPDRAVTCTADPTTGEINQGIGAGREDVYGKGLAGQMIGIDGLSAGEYWLEIEVNPQNENGQRTILESDYNNNITRVRISI